MNHCILFLDFDGVTHPDESLRELWFCRAPLIEEVLLEFQLVQLVISSMWREHYSIDELKGFLPVSLTARVVGVTPIKRKLSEKWVPGPASDFEREWECEFWMKENKPWGTPWVAIDDRPFLFSLNCQNLLVTDPTFGFHSSDQKTLRDMLEARQ